jgi:hypothetical protein
MHAYATESEIFCYGVLTYIGLLLSFFLDTVLRFFSLLLGLHFGSNGTYFDPLKRRYKVRIKGKRIVCRYLARWWMFLQNFELRACEGLQLSL